MQEKGYRSPNISDGQLVEKLRELAEVLQRATWLRCSTTQHFDDVYIILDSLSILANLNRNFCFHGSEITNVSWPGQSNISRVYPQSHTCRLDPGILEHTQSQRLQGLVSSQRDRRSRTRVTRKPSSFTVSNDNVTHDITLLIILLLQGSAFFTKRRRQMHYIAFSFQQAWPLFKNCLRRGVLTVCYHWSCRPSLWESKQELSQFAFACVKHSWLFFKRVGRIKDIGVEHFSMDTGISEGVKNRLAFSSLNPTIESGYKWMWDKISCWSYHCTASKDARKSDYCSVANIRTESHLLFRIWSRELQALLLSFGIHCTGFTPFNSVRSQNPVNLLLAFWSIQ